jgi:surface carbohydrate biosynthesis protein
MKRYGAVVYLPLEVFGRELDGKLLLAAELVSRGMKVVIGHKTVVKDYALAERRSGVWYALACREKEARFARALRKHGILTVGQDEEAGTIYDQFADFHSLRSDKWCMGDFDAFFTWGKDDYEFLLGEYSSFESRIYLTGSPRGALLGPVGQIFYSEEIKDLKRSYGEFILIVTGFQYGTDSIWARNSGDRLSVLVEEEHMLMESFADAVKMLATGSGKKIVLRPHPCENKEFWMNVAKGYPNIYISAEGCATPWVMSAQLVVQNSSTIGLEAVLCGTPAVAFSRGDVGFFRQNKKVPDSIMPRVLSCDRLLRFSLGKASERGEGDIDADKSLVMRKVAFAGTVDPVKRQADVIERLCQSAESENLGKITSRYIRRAFRFLGEKPVLDPSTAREKNKRPGISESYIEEKLVSSMKILTRQQGVNIKRIGRDTFFLTKDY